MAGHLATSVATLTDVLFERAEVGLCLVAPDGTVLRANAEWLRSTGFSLDDVIGADLVALFPGTRDLALALHARARAGHHVEVSRHAQLIEGRETWWEGSIDPIQMEGGTGLLITARQVTPASTPNEGAGERERLALALESAEMGMWEWDVRADVSVWNAQEYRLLGLPEGSGLEPTGRFFDAVHSEDVAGLRAGLAATMKRGGEWRGEFRVVRPDGETRWVMGVGRLFSDPQGKPLRMIGINYDITDRKRGEEALRESESRFRTVIENSHDGINMLDLATGKYVFMSPAQVALTGFTREEILGMSAEEAHNRVHPDDRDLSKRQQQAIASGAEPESTVVYRWKVKSGEYRWFSDSRKLVRDAEGRPVALVGVSRDITDNKRAEEALRNSEERFRVAQELSPDGFTLLRPVRDSDGHIVDFVWVYENAAVARLNGTDPRAVVGRRLLDLFPNHADTPFHKTYVQVAETGQPSVVEAPYQGGAMPEKKWLRVAVVRSRGEDIAVLAQDITERKRDEQALRVSEEQYRLLHENMRDAFVRVDMEGRVVECNALYCRMLGYSAEELHALTYLDLTPERWHAFEAVIVRDQILTRGYSEVYEKEYRRKDGTVFPVELRTVLARDAEGQPSGMWAMIRDVTERKRAEEALRDADVRKNDFLATLGHELRNPLAPIRNAAYILERADPNGEQAERARGVLRRQSEHLTRLVDDLLDVTRITRGKIAIQRARLSLRDVVLRAVEDIWPTMAEKGVAFRADVPPEDVWAHADGTRLNQVVANLLHNASKFTRRGDEVVVSLSAEENEAVIRVRDTGAGIEPTALPHIFEAFVQADRTIARSEGGLGLGLALVKGIVELHGGEVRAESAGIGKGTEFVVRLPLQGPMGSATPSGTTSATRLKTGRRVLVVDDNKDAAESLADILRMDGHDVDVAHDGPTALEKVGARRPEVVLCDIGLPGMSGYEIARAIRATGGAKVKLVALSGYTQGDDIRRAQEAGFDSHVAKPPDPKEIARLLA